MAVVFAFTLGSNGRHGRSFLADLKQAHRKSLTSALIGGVAFNAANILLVAAIDIAGMAVAFPVGIGIALVLGVVVNYLRTPKGNPKTPLRRGGVGHRRNRALRLGLQAVAGAERERRRLGADHIGRGRRLDGLLLPVCGQLDVRRLHRDDSGQAEPPTRLMVFFAIGIFLSNFVFNTAIMLKPFTGEPVSPMAYFAGAPIDHLWGVLGGMIWAVGMTFSIIAFGVAGPAISYGLGQGATLVAALWGVFIWREFQNAPPETTPFIALMFLGYLVGLG